MIEPCSHPDYHWNESHCGDGREPCCICGKPVNVKTCKWVMIGGPCNVTFLTPDEAKTDLNAGVFPIGPDCYRRNKKDLRA